MDFTLEDSVDENSLDDNLVDTISEMFTDEHALDYSSPPLWDDYDDNLFDLETVNDDTYDDPFYSKEEKIKDSKILIDELDPPRSSDFLPSPECDLVFYEDFSEVDALSSTNNEDKIFNPEILIHENHFEVTNLATMEKNVKKITYASLILEDFNPPLYELPFHKEVPGLGALLSFSSENEEKVFNPGILTSKGVHSSLLLELSHRDSKAFKVIKIFESPMEIFPCSYGEDIRILDVPSCLASDLFPPGNNNPLSPPPPFHNSLSGSTTSSSPSLPISETSDYFHEEFADELALIIFPPGNDDLPFDAESDLRELEYLLNHDPIKEMEFTLEDSVDKNSPNDNLVDTISEMFTDEHALDYSSPLIWDDYDDELFDLDTVNDNTYDDPFDSKEEKIKDSKILIDELNPPRSSILIHENLYKVTNCETMENNVKKISISNASLILEDFNPPLSLYELPFHKEVPGLRALLLFSSENEEKETDIRQKDEKSSQNDKTEHGMEEREKNLGLQDEWKAEINFPILLTPKAHLSKPLTEEAQLKTQDLEDSSINIG
ncbi:hypothetical protein Tco_1476749 [Tanacetum coccineum]